MNDVRQTGNQAKTDGANVDLGAAAKLKQDDGSDQMATVAKTAAYPLESCRVLRSMRLIVAWRRDFAV